MLNALTTTPDTNKKIRLVWKLISPKLKFAICNSAAAFNNKFTEPELLR